MDEQVRVEGETALLAVQSWRTQLSAGFPCVQPGVSLDRRSSDEQMLATSRYHKRNQAKKVSLIELLSLNLFQNKTVTRTLLETGIMMNWN